MQVSEVDERDSRWEARARFRLFLYKGPQSDVTALDVREAQLREVLEAAELAAEDGMLWSLALVQDDSAAGRGLVWISGLDYHGTPVTEAEWRARAEMQDRYLSKQTRTQQPPLLPDGRRVIRFFPDHGHDWPLWESFSDSYVRTPSDLGVSEELTARLRLWYDEWETGFASERDQDTWSEVGRQLATALQKELGEFAEVRPLFLSGPGQAA